MDKLNTEGEENWKSLVTARPTRSMPQAKISQKLASVANNIQIDICYFLFQVQDKNKEQKSQLVHFFYKATFDEEQV